MDPVASRRSGTHWITHGISLSRRPLFKAANCADADVDGDGKADGDGDDSTISWDEAARIIKSEIVRMYGSVGNYLISASGDFF